MITSHFKGTFSLNSSIFREEVTKVPSKSFSTELQLKQPTPKPLKIKITFQEEAGLSEEKYHVVTDYFQ